jgi:hypothetical protein
MLVVPALLYPASLQSGLSRLVHFSPEGHMPDYRTSDLFVPTLSFARETLQGPPADLCKQQRRGIQYLIALAEMTFMFARYCPKELETPAKLKLMVFFERTIGYFIESDKMGWLEEPERRSFALACVKYLASDAHKKGAALEAITDEVLNQAAQTMINDKDKDCPLPLDLLAEGDGVAIDSDLVIFSSACDTLQEIINHELAEMA